MAKSVYEYVRQIPNVLLPVSLVADITFSDIYWPGLDTSLDDA